MKIYHEIVQGSPQWARLRALHFTASELGPFALEPVKITLTVDEIKAELDSMGVPRKGLTKRDDLLAILPGREAYAKLCSGAQTAIISAIKKERMQAFRDRIEDANTAGEPAKFTAEEDILFSREEELAAKEEKSFEYNIPVKYGKQLEPFARAYYQTKTGHAVTEVGFIAHDSGGFGCSPDGLVPYMDGYSHGCEIKCPIPETHIGWLLDGGLPDDHKFQVHACMAVTGLDRWDFLSYCPGEAPLLIGVHRDSFTDQLEAGLKTLVIEKEKIKRRLDALWGREFLEASPKTPKP
jgi:hypothetical protein